MDRMSRSSRSPLLALKLVLLAACAGPRGADAPAAAEPHVLHAWSRPEQARWVAPARGPLLWPEVECAPFDELLPSWNAEVPPECRLAVDVRVSAATGAWSPWLTLGGWNRGGSLGSRTVEWHTDQGTVHVAIDVLESEFPLSRYQLRFTAAGESAVRLDAVHVVASDTARIPSRPLRRDLAQSIELDVPARSQRVEDPEIAARICSPTSVTMALAYFGAEHSTATVAETLFDPDHDIYGNWNRAVQGAFELGVRGYLTRINHWGEVAGHLRAGEPLVISIRADAGELEGAPYPRTSGHLLTIRGLTDDGHALVNDPAAHEVEDVPRRYRLSDLETVWLRRNGVAYVFTGPR